MRKRTHEIKVRLNDKELDHLNKMVGKNNYTRENFLRLMIAGYTVQEVPKDYLMFKIDMARMCSTLRCNSLNTCLSPEERATLLNAANELASVAAEMRRIYTPNYKERRQKHD